jgi:predicted permease
MFGIIDRLLLQPPLHVQDAEDVRRVLVRRPGVTGQPMTQAAFAYPDYQDLKAHEGLSVAAYDYGRLLTVGRDDAASRARGAAASAEFFPLLGVQPRLGRFFTPDETAVGSPLTAVISEEYWQAAYANDPDVLGRTLEIDGDLIPIIGVTPAGFTGTELQSVDVWLPLEALQGRQEGSQGCGTSRNCYWLFVVARLDGDVSVELAELEATRLHINGRRVDLDEGRYSESATIVLAPLMAGAGAEPSAESRVAKWLAGVALVVLLIACANVANLLLARGTRMRKETAVRLALGIDRMRLIVQMTCEAVLLALVGGGLAIAVARWGGQLIRESLLPQVYFPDSALNARVIAFTLVASVLAGLLASIAPALQSAALGLTGDFKEGERGNSGARSRLRGFLTVSQAAMSVVLLVGAGLFIRSLTELRGQDLGLEVGRLLLVDLELSIPFDPVDASTRNEIYREVMRRAEALPSVEAVAGTATPLQFSLSIPVRAERVDSTPRLAGGGPYVTSVTPRYFETTGITITRGRAIDERDGADAEKVAVVSEAMAQLFWPEAEPLGRCLLVNRSTECTRVIGVAENAARGGYRDQPAGAYYLPMTQGPNSTLQAPNGLYIRARGSVSETQETLTGALRSLPAPVRWVRVMSLQDMLDPQARSWTLGATMFTVFGGLALLLAAIGLYSVLAFDVAQRTRELGIRSALGAQRGRLMRSVLYRGASMGGLGIALGLTVAYLAAPYAADLLFEVSPRDPGVLALVAATLVVVSCVASLVPGLRATRIDPMAALRAE